MIQAVLRGGEILGEGDEVATEYHSSCVDKIFVIKSITKFAECESGYHVLAYMKDDEEKVLKGTTDGNGIDANWFKPVIKK